MRQVIDKINVTEEEIKDFYAKLEYKIQASHILVRDEDTAGAIMDSIAHSKTAAILDFSFGARWIRFSRNRSSK